MAGINKVMILGNLGRDPEVKTTQSGMTVAALNLATSRKLKTGETETEWHRVNLFGRTAEIARDYLHKGDAAFIEGRLHTRKYTDKQGVERWITEINGDNLTLMGGRQQGNQQSNQQGAQPAQQYAPAQSAGGFDECPF